MHFITCSQKISVHNLAKLPAKLNQACTLRIKNTPSACHTEAASSQGTGAQKYLLFSVAEDGLPGYPQNKLLVEKLDLDKGI